MGEESERIMSMEEQGQDDWQYSLRPRRLNEYIGQDKVKENLSVFIKAALSRGEAPVSYTHLTLPTICSV